MNAIWIPIVCLVITGLAGLFAFLAKRAVSGLDSQLSKIEECQKEDSEKQWEYIYAYGMSVAALEERTKHL